MKLLKENFMIFNMQLNNKIEIMKNIKQMDLYNLILFGQ